MLFFIMESSEFTPTGIGVRAPLDLGGGGGAVTLLPGKNYTMPESTCQCTNALKSQ